jgi:hypothetical protein
VDKNDKSAKDKTRSEEVVGIPKAPNFVSRAHIPDDQTAIVKQRQKEMITTEIKNKKIGPCTLVIQIFLSRFPALSRWVRSSPTVDVGGCSYGWNGRAGVRPWKSCPLPELLPSLRRLLGEWDVGAWGAVFRRSGAPQEIGHVVHAVVESVAAETVPRGTGSAGFKLLPADCRSRGGCAYGCSGGPDGGSHAILGGNGVAS